MSRTATPEVTTLDVRPLLAAGEEPFAVIMETARRIPAGGVLELIAPFEPVPLYRVLTAEGFSHTTEILGDEAYVVRFHRPDIELTDRVDAVYARYPAAAPVLAEIGIDLCCGGAQSVATAARAHGAEPAALLQRLRVAASTGA
jgi:uncharacterized protein (DUF2249 family)